MTRSEFAHCAWHHFVQLLCFRQRIPSIRLTEAARDQLLLHLSRITEFQPVASLLWSANVVGGVAQEARWGVGFYNIGTRPYGRVTRVQGVPFVFTGARDYTRLNGATLDYRDGRFVVEGADRERHDPGAH
jgi:hypothetical protein